MNMKTNWITLILVLTVTAVTASPLRSVRVSDFSPSRENATEALQRAINSGAEHVIIDNVGFEYRLSSTIRLRSNLTLEIASGVTIAAKANAFKKINDFFFLASGCRNLTIRGAGIGKSILRMNKKAYLDPKKYEPSEWRHLLAFFSCSNVIIRDLSLLSSGGDGIYLGANNPKLPYCKDIVIDNVECRDNNRQGISVISAENLLIRNCLLTDTAGAAPMAGIDFEPNPKPAGQRLVNCIMDSCLIKGNAGNGIEFFTVYLNKNSAPLSITIRDCTITGNKRSGAMITTTYPRKWEYKESGATGFIRFEHCKFNDNAIAEWMLQDNQVNSIKISFVNCQIKHYAQASDSPIVFATTRMSGNKHGGYTFNKITINDENSKRPVAKYRNWTGVPLAPFMGNLPGIDFHDIINKNKQKTFENAVGRLPENATIEGKYLTAIRTCGKIVLKCKGKGGKKKVRLDFRLASWSFHHHRSCIITVADASNKEITRLKLNAKQKQGLLDLSLPSNTFYTIKANSGLDSLEIKYKDALIEAKSPVSFTGTVQNLFFLVPAKTTKFQISIAGQLTKPLDAEILNAKRKVVMGWKNIEEPYIFTIKRPKESPAEVWELKLNKVNSSAKVTLGSGLLPFLSTKPELFDFFTGKKK